MTPGPDRVCVGVIAGAHGVRGQVRIKAFTERPEAVAAYGPVMDEAGDRRFVLRLRGATRGQMIAQVEGITSREAAQALKGLRLYVARAALPEPERDEYYHADLIGLRVERSDGTPLGRVVAVRDFGAGDLLEVERPGAPSAFLPFTRAVVAVVDLAAGRLVAEPPPGLLDPVEPEAGQ